jgi:hypothetical protein
MAGAGAGLLLLVLLGYALFIGFYPLSVALVTLIAIEWKRKADDREKRGLLGHSRLFWVVVFLWIPSAFVWLEVV